MKVCFRSWSWLISVLAAISMTAGAFAFSGGGHKFVGLVAWQQLSPQARQTIVTLLANHPRFQQDFLGKMGDAIANGSATNREQWLFAQASVWPDMARDFPEFDHPSWHYINLPIFLSASDEQALSNSIYVNTTTSWKSWMGDKDLNAVQVLDRIAQTFRSSSITNQDRALLLCWTMHIIGDLHQPLHCAALFSEKQFPKGDKGGNAIEVNPSLFGDNTKLHSLWDGLLGYDVPHTAALKRVTETRAIPGLVQQAEQSAALDAPIDWAAEGNEYAARYAYAPELRSQIATQHAGHLSVVKLPANYQSTAGQVARMRALIGGYRLAKFLDALLQN